MTDKELAEIKARVEAATPGPWNGWITSASNGVPLSANIVNQLGVLVGKFGAHLSRDGLPSDEDLTLMSEAREDIPALLAEVERMRDLARAVADGPLYYSEQPQGWVCSMCGAITPDEWGQHSYSNESESDRAKRVIYHAKGCPVLKARAILGQ